jgi:hypothetical protein
MKGIIPGVGALMTWTIIPGTGVHFFLVGCYPSTGGHFWLLSQWEAILVIILVQEAKFSYLIIGGP